MGRFMKVKILDRCNVSPSAAAAPHHSGITSLPLTFFDIPWLLFPPSQNLFFYDYPHYSTVDFLTLVLPLLKASLSQALRSFFPFAGVLRIGSGGGGGGGGALPAIACSDDGLGISVIVAESNGGGDEFDGVVARELGRDGERFECLVPSLLGPGDEEVVPLMAVQITVFPGCGFSLGISYHHVAADERTFNNFLKSWTSFSRFPGSSPTLLVETASMERRTIIRDRRSVILQQRFVNEWWKKRQSSSLSPIRVKPLNVVRSTFVVCPAQMNLIKSQVLAHCALKNLPLPVHLSPYVLVCCLVWVNWVKAHLINSPSDQPVQTQEPIYFGFIAGGITRLDYVVSETYFGNCVGFGRGEAICEEVIGGDGMVVAASAIGKAIKKLDKSLLDGAERWIREWEVFSYSSSSSSSDEINLNLMVSGSPKVEFYDTDFGWGKPKKIEQVSIDRTRGISLHQSRDVQGGMEVGLSLPTPIMDTFTSLFIQALKDLPIIDSSPLST